MRFVLFLILEAHLYIICIILVSYVIERVTGLKLIIDAFFDEEKEEDIANGAASFNSIGYFTISLIVFLYHLYIKKTELGANAFWKWLLIMLPLTIIFRILYYRWQGKKSQKQDSIAE